MIYDLKRSLDLRCLFDLVLHSSLDDLVLFEKKKTPYESVLCTDLIKCGWISISLFQLWGKHYRSHTRGERWRQAGRNSSSNRETLSGSNSGHLSWNIICTPPHIPLLIINFGVRIATRNKTENCPMMRYVRCIALIYVNSANTASLFPKYKKSDGSQDARRGSSDMAN